MICNQASCEIYIGKKAGDKLLNEIRNAKKSIRIVSPFLSASLVSELITLRQKNIKVELITSDEIEDFKRFDEQNIRQLIIQNKTTDFRALEKREKWKHQMKMLTITGLFLLAILMIVFYFTLNYFLLYGLVPVILLFFISLYLKEKVRNQRIYNYWYSQLFPFKVYMSYFASRLSNMTIHSKIYLIDDRIAHLGSLNFTTSGMNHNYETRVRTTDPEAVQKMAEEFNWLMNRSNLPEKDIQVWGRELFPEPVN